MKVGTALSVLAEAGRVDASVWHEHMVMGDLAEPLGFDSLWALEHHFTGYSMSPAPLQTLAYYAGRTKKIQLGTCVIVLPWHDPIRVAEQIGLLDIMCGGRCLFGFGRGAATTEYEGFRIPMDEARPRFIEAAKILKISQPKISLLLRGYLDDFSLERLLRFLNDLGQDVYISIVASHSGHGSTMIGDSPSTARIAALSK